MEEAEDTRSNATDSQSEYASQPTSNNSSTHEIPSIKIDEDHSTASHSHNKVLVRSLSDGSGREGSSSPSPSPSPRQEASSSGALLPESKYSF